MGAKLLLPGMGGKYTSETFTSSSTTGADTIDMSRCAQFIAQIIVVTTAVGSIQLEQSVDGVNWATYGTTIDVATNGATFRGDVTDGPLGIFRINATNIDSGTAYLIIVGYPLQTVN